MVAFRRLLKVCALGAVHDPEGSGRGNHGALERFGREESAPDRAYTVPLPAGRGDEPCLAEP